MPTSPDSTADGSPTTAQTHGDLVSCGAAADESKRQRFGHEHAIKMLSERDNALLRLIEISEESAAAKVMADERCANATENSSSKAASLNRILATIAALNHDFDNDRVNESAKANER